MALCNEVQINFLIDEAHFLEIDFSSLGLIRMVWRKKIKFLGLYYFYG